ncbi:MAG: hypothetical protein WBD56_01090 [Anaerolineales bacterium]
MSTNVETPVSRVVVSPRQATQLNEVVETIIEEALECARLKIPPIRQEQDLDILFQQHDFFCTFKYGLADEVGRVIGEYDVNMEEIYLFEPCANPDFQSGEDMPIDGTINLILVVSSPTAGLEAFIASLDRSLTQSLKELPLPILAKYDSVLNAILITKKDLELGKGHAALVTSIFTPPLKVWQRL